MQTHYIHAACDSKWDTVAFYVIFLNINRSGVLSYMASATWKCCHLSTRSLYTIQPCTSFQCYFIWHHRHRMHAYLPVTCYPPFWQNDKDLFPLSLLQEIKICNDTHKMIKFRKQIKVSNTACHSINMHTRYSKVVTLQIMTNCMKIMKGKKGGRKHTESLIWGSS